jgi:hypothetical protein
MDIQQLVAALTACTNPDAIIRKAGEEAVKQVRLFLLFKTHLDPITFCIFGC